MCRRGKRERRPVTTAMVLSSWRLEWGVGGRRGRRGLPSRRSGGAGRARVRARRRARAAPAAPRAAETVTDPSVVRSLRSRMQRTELLDWDVEVHPYPGGYPEGPGTTAAGG